MINAIRWQTYIGRLQHDNSLNQTNLFTIHPWSISVQVKVAACFNTAALYDYTYGRKESVPYWQEDRQPFPVEHENNIAWSAITKASRLWPWGKTKW